MFHPPLVILIFVISSSATITCVIIVHVSLKHATLTHVIIEPTLSVYPGIVKNCGPKSLNSKFLNNSDVGRLIEKHIKRGIKIDFPKHRWTSCGASCLNTYVIGPKGELYKCWEDIGVEGQEIGNVGSLNFTNPALFNKYMLYGSHYTSTECQKCSILPICSKDCPHDRLSNIFEKTDKELCCIYKNNDGELLKYALGEYYKLLKS